MLHLYYPFKLRLANCSLVSFAISTPTTLQIIKPHARQLLRVTELNVCVCLLYFTTIGVMSQQRPRTKNFDAEEEETLLKLANNHKVIVGNKTTKAVNANAKKEICLLPFAIESTRRSPSRLI